MCVIGAKTTKLIPFRRQILSAKNVCPFIFCLVFYPTALGGCVVCFVETDTLRLAGFIQMRHVLVFVCATYVIL